jgi:glutamate dehydrogenase
LNSISKQSSLQRVLKSISFETQTFRDFAERFLQHMSAAALNRLKPAEIKKLLESGWSFIQSWDAKKPKVLFEHFPPSAKNNDRGTVIQLLLPNLPFVADSISTNLRRKGYDISFMLRSAYKISRSNSILSDLQVGNGVSNELALYIELRQQIERAERETLEDEILSLIHDIQLAVNDFTSMITVLESSRAQLLSSSRTHEAAFLEWAAKDNFIFLGTTQITNKIISNSFGILKQSDIYADLLSELTRSSISTTKSLWLHKNSFASKIDRNEPLDVIRLPLESGKEIVFVGIFTYAAKSTSFEHIPYVSNKMHAVLNNFSSENDTFDRKEVITTINHLPLVEISTLSPADIGHICKGILTHQSHYTTLVHHQFSAALQQLSILIYMHQYKLNDGARSNIQQLLEDLIESPILHSETTYLDNDLACLYCILSTPTDPKDELASLPKKLSDATLSWSDRVRTELIDLCGLIEGETLSKSYSDMFDAAYKSTYTPAIAAKDILAISTSHKHHTPISLDVYDQIPTTGGYQFRLKLFKESSSVALFQLFSLLNSLGLKFISQASFHVTSLSLNTTYWINDLLLQSPYQTDFDKVYDSFKTLCQKVLSGEIATDDLNSLTLTEGLTYRQVILLKAFLSYFKQIQFTLGGKYSRDILIRNSKLTATIVQLFEAKFSPFIKDADRVAVIQGLNDQFEHMLKNLHTEDEDKLFRHLYNLVTYTLRTNYFVEDANGHPKSYISFKIDSKNILDIPLPTPMVEVFVYSKEFEAIHLRYGKISRGGIRWSDRGEDYRTEVLGLVKAQNTKNAVIVPMGSKGGFYIKKQPASQTDVTTCYQNMMRGLLDITDNLIHGKVKHPKNVVRYDEDDPYLVVAADKGTASFSDIANGISAEYNHWLKDAFASGGSAGYDHKKMAITSKGAWESVKQHCKEALNLNPETDTITAVGIGDMSGDVFGNGLLRSKTILLKAAFNHQHIFIDPTPNAELSYHERERLFNLPRSTWADYSTSALSNGGMIIERVSKSVTLTPEAKALLGVTHESVRPADIMQAILKADVDLMWLGGIGTYIKAESETNEAVSDRANDAIRINGQDVRAKIIAEGANLGCTQKGRIEYALMRNGRINTDFIDNSGGVDCSDHEVNIKILLNQLVDAGEMTLDDRNALLKQMTPTIVIDVTSENVQQNLALSYAAHDSATYLTEYAAMTQYLKTHAGLNPAIEFLPSAKEFNERQTLKQGLTRPELAVLLSYTKNHLKAELLKTPLLDHSYLQSFLMDYFPQELSKYSKEMKSHPLRHNIISTKVTSEIVDRLGIHFMHRILHQTGRSMADVLNVYMIVKKFFNLNNIWHQFDTNLSELTYEDRIDFIHSISETVYNACAWLLTYVANPTNDLIKTFESVLNQVRTTNLIWSRSTECVIPSHKDTTLKQSIYDLHQRLTSLHLSTFSKTLTQEQLLQFESTHTQLQFVFGFDQLNQMIKSIVSTNFWGQLFTLGTQLELEYLQGHLTNSICVFILTHRTAIDTILEPYRENITWLLHLIQQTLTSSSYEPAAISVIIRHLHSLTNAIINGLETSQ